MGNATTLDAGAVDPTTQADATTPRAYLVVRHAGRAQVIDLDDGSVISFGRSPESTVELDDQQASREHAQIVRRGNDVEVVDLGSRNGTRVGDALLRNDRRTLVSGDRVLIGSAEILFAESLHRGAGQRARLVDELAHALASTGEALLLRLPVDAEQLGALVPALRGALLIEAQPDGDYACLFDRAATGEAAQKSVTAAAPELRLGVARAPLDGRDAPTLWQHTAGPRTARTPATAPPGLVVADAAMFDVFGKVKKLAATTTTVLILGETGVGKEVIAEQLHQQSPRATGPFLRINCGSLPETLLDSELFGHEKGAFTGADRKKVGYIEAAHGGTLFLDEVGELTPSAQTRLLRVLEERKLMRVGGREEIAVDVRVIAATNRQLETFVKSGQFRADLYFRLSTFVLAVPPLRERPAEIELLAELFARQHARRMKVAPPIIGREAMQLLRRHAWPGNVRELRNAMEHAVVLASDLGELGPEHLPDSLRRAAPLPATSPVGGATGGGGPMREQLADVERRSIEDALDAEAGNQTRAAKRLGISRRALIYKLDKYDIKR